MDILGQPLVYSDPMPLAQAVLVGAGFACAIGFLAYCLLKAL